MRSAVSNMLSEERLYRRVTEQGRLQVDVHEPSAVAAPTLNELDQLGGQERGDDNSLRRWVRLHFVQIRRTG